MSDRKGYIMDLFRIITDHTRDQWDSLGTVYGTIYLKYGEVSFPNSDWEDFVLPILNMWLESLFRLITVPKKKQIFYFMDGDFEWSAEITTDKLVHISLIKNHKIGDACLKRFFIPLEQLVDAVMQAVEPIVGSSIHKDNNQKGDLVAKYKRIQLLCK